MAQCRAPKGQRVFTPHELTLGRRIWCYGPDECIENIERGSRLPHNTSLRSASDGSTFLGLLTLHCAAHQLAHMKLTVEICPDRRIS